MAAKRILFYDGTHLVAYLWHSGRVTHEGEFLPEPVGIEALEGYLRQHKSSLFYLLADVAEEGFQLEDIPYIQGGDRTAMLSRRLGQYFYGTPLSLALSLGRATEGRRDEKILFAALTRHEAFTPWLEALRTTEVALAGVYSVPLILSDLAPRLAGDLGDRVLFISLTRAGVRQSFFDGGKLHFSRLSQLATRGLDEVAIACANEAGKIHQYLVGQRLVPRGTTLRTIVLAHPDQMPALRIHCRDTAELAFEFIDLDEAARREGLKTPLADRRSEALFIHRLAARPPAKQFAPAAARRFYYLWLARFTLTSVAWVALAGCLLFAAKTGLQLQDTRQHIDSINAQIATDTQRYEAILNGLPKVAITPENLRALMARYDEVAKRTTLLDPMLAHLGAALTELPRIELTRLDWTLSDRLDTGEKVGAGATATPPVPAPNAGGAWAIIDIRGQLPLALSSDLRAQIDTVEQLATRLRAPGYEVRVLSMPFDVESGKPLKSRADSTGTAEAPRFSLRLARKF